MGGRQILYKFPFSHTFLYLKVTKKSKENCFEIWNPMSFSELLMV